MRLDLDRFVKECINDNEYCALGYRYADGSPLAEWLDAKSFTPDIIDFTHLVAKKMVAHCSETMFLDSCAEAFAGTESPIEQLFIVSMCGLLFIENEPCYLYWSGPTGNSAMASFVEMTTHQTGRYSISCQEPIGVYRADFVINWSDCNFCGTGHNYGFDIVIECDGHDNHERTKKQAAHDRKRDRFMQTEGYTVLRFTGSELWANPMKCAYEVYNHIEKRVSEVRTQWHDAIRREKQSGAD